MQKQEKGKHFFLLEWLLNMLVFTLVFAVVPFYTGTQNTYFLHGLAQAGYQWLSYDWLANTTDSKPVFSLLVSIVYASTGVWGFYFLYVLLLGVYINSILSIINYTTYGFFRQTVLHKLMLFSVLLLLHSGAVDEWMVNLMGFSFHRIFPEGLAQQSVIDHYFQSQTFGVFLLLSLAFFLKRRYYAAIITCCLVTLIHISYLLPAVLITLSCLGFLIFREKNYLKACKGGVLGLLIIAPIVVYTVVRLMPLSEMAKEILYVYRIPHHANPRYWSLDLTALKVGLMLLVFVLIRARKSLFIIYGVLFTSALVLTLLQVYTGSRSLALMFPWRISVFLYPLSVSLLLAFILQGPLYQLFRLPRAKLFVQAGLYVLIMLLGTAGVMLTVEKFEQKKQFRQALQQAVQPVLSSPYNYGSVLIPLELEDFRLTTGLPAFVDYKSHPYQSRELEEWYRRVQAGARFYRHQMENTEISNFLSQYHLRFVLTSAARPLPHSYLLKKVYSSREYILYQANLPD